jgi:hypothetical protein
MDLYNPNLTCLALFGLYISSSSTKREEVVTYLMDSSESESEDFVGFSHCAQRVSSFAAFWDLGLDIVTCNQYMIEIGNGRISITKTSKKGRG